VCVRKRSRCRGGEPEAWKTKTMSTTCSSPPRFPSARTLSEVRWRYNMVARRGGERRHWRRHEPNADRVLKGTS
jgi:hypothetical protein